MNLWIDSEIPPDNDYLWVKSPNKMIKMLSMVISNVSIGNKLDYLSLDDIIDIIAIHNNRIELVEIHCDGDHHDRIKRIKEKLNARVKTYAFGKLYDQENM
jgi:hypothetical protein